MTAPTGRSREFLCRREPKLSCCSTNINDRQGAEIEQDIHCCNECHTVHKLQYSFPAASRWSDDRNQVFFSKLSFLTIRPGNKYKCLSSHIRPSEWAKLGNTRCGSWSSLKTFHALARHLQLNCQTSLVLSIFVYLLYGFSTKSAAPSQSPRVSGAPPGLGPVAPASAGRRRNPCWFLRAFSNRILDINRIQ